MHGLTKRDLEAPRLLAAGHRNREMGELLCISPITAARHVANISNTVGGDSAVVANPFQAPAAGALVRGQFRPRAESGGLLRQAARSGLDRAADASD